MTKKIREVYESVIFRPLSCLWVVSMTLFYLLAEGTIGLAGCLAVISFVSILLIIVGIRHEMAVIRQKLEEDLEQARRDAGKE